MTTVDLHVELYIDGAWTEVNGTGRVRVQGLDGRSAVTIEWGSTTRGTEYRPTRATFQVYDPDAYLNNDNPYSPWYGKIGDNTLGRVRVGASDIRIVGELARRSPTWALAGGADAVVGCEIVGQSRRLEAGTKPALSPALRSLTTADSRSTMVAYWALEDDAGTTEITSEIGPTPTIFGLPGFGAYTSHPVSARLVTLTTGSQLEFIAPTHVATGEYKFITVCHVPSSTVDGARLYRLYFSGGTLGWIELWLRDDTVSPAERIEAWLYDSGGNAIDAPDVVAQDILWDGDTTISIEIRQNGANLDFNILVVGQPETATALLTGAVAGVTMGTWMGALFSPSDVIVDLPLNGKPADGVSVGHFAVGNETTGFADFISPTVPAGTLGTRAFTGDTAGYRIERLYADRGLALEVLPTSDGIEFSEKVGPQRIATFRELIEDANAVDGGLIGDARDALAGFWRPRRSLYSQAPKAWLTYRAPTAHLSDHLNPVSGDTLARTNDVTAQRDGGSSGHYAITVADGYHGTIYDPPAGIGQYDVAPPYHAYRDVQMQPIAAWAAHIGSWLEQLYDSVTVDLTRPVFISNPTLAAQVASIFAGDTMAIDTSGSSRWLPPDTLELMAIGATETLGQNGRTIKFSTIPARTYEVWQVETGGSALANTQTTSSTAWRVATSLGPTWSTRVPYFFQSGGEAVRVTAVSTETITVGTPGTAATGNNGASVAPGIPASLNPGDAMVLVAAIRSSGTGTVNTPTGWTLLPGCDGSNLRVFGKYFQTGDPAPTVSFTGGAAGDDTYARIIPAPGASLEAGGGSMAVPSAIAQLNGSATNIAYPGLSVVRDGSVVFYVGWRQDDATSVATIAGATEDIDTALTTGNDMHIVVDHVIQTTATAIASGSFTVTTGGGAAISRAIVLALRPLQAITVVRGQNNVSVTIAAGSPVKGWRMGVNAL